MNLLLFLLGSNILGLFLTHDITDYLAFTAGQIICVGAVVIFSISYRLLK